MYVDAAVIARSKAVFESKGVAGVDVLGIRLGTGPGARAKGFRCDVSGAAAVLVERNAPMLSVHRRLDPRATHFELIGSEWLRNRARASLPKDRDVTVTLPLMVQLLIADPHIEDDRLKRAVALAARYARGSSKRRVLVLVLVLSVAVPVACLALHASLWRHRFSGTYAPTAMRAYMTLAIPALSVAALWF